MLSLLRRVAITVSALTLMLGIVTPAIADTYNHRDARHDVSRTLGGSDYEQARAMRKVDVTNLQIFHGMHRVRLEVSLRSIALKGLRWRTLAFKMKTNNHAYSGYWKAEHGNVQVDVRDETIHQSVSCEMAGRPKGDTLVWTIDRTCFKNPEWIRVAVSVGGRTRGWAYQDNAQTSSWRHPLKDSFSPRLPAST